MRFSILPRAQSAFLGAQPQPVQRAFARQRLLAHAQAFRSLSPARIVPSLIVIAQILVAQGQPVDASGNQFL
jgi:hypothetical protein